MRNQLAAVVLALVVPRIASLCAQVPSAYLVGTVRDSVTRVPVAGAVVSLLDAGGTVSTRRLSNERGEYRIPLGVGDDRVRVIRIGFEARDLTVPLRASGGARLDISLIALPTMMRSVRVVANASCPRRADAPETLGLWEQAQAGLLATVVARQQNPAAIVRLLSELILDDNSARVRTFRVRVDSSVDTISFVAARSARDFALHGFQYDSAGRRTYFGPDAIVLLSDAFAASYCFRIDSGGIERPNQAGIHFAPVSRRRDRVDIDGTLWIDTVSRQLRDVEFRYLGLAAASEELNPGGRVSFMTMQNGIVLVDSWMIRSVNTRTDSGMGLLNGVFQPLRRTTLFAVELGGQLARASWPDGTHWKAPLGAFRARAVSPAGKLAVGTRVSLEGTPYSGIVDSTGTVTIPDLLPGPYSVQIADPRIDTLHLAFPTPLKFIAVADSIADATLTVPTLESLVTEACKKFEQSARDSVYVFGRVMTADGTPVANAKVTFRARRLGAVIRHPENVVTEADGIFESCDGWRMDDQIVLLVSRPGKKDIEVTRTFDSRVAVVRVDVVP